MVLYILSSGQVLLSALIWCSACTSVSEGLFLMYPWRDVLYIHLLLCHLVLLLLYLYKMPSMCLALGRLQDMIAYLVPFCAILTYVAGK